MRNLQESIRNDIDKLSEAPVELVDDKVTYEIEAIYDTVIKYEIVLSEDQWLEILEEVGQGDDEDLDDADEIMSIVQDEYGGTPKDVDRDYVSHYKIKKYVNGMLDNTVQDDLYDHRG